MGPNRPTALMSAAGRSQVQRVPAGKPPQQRRPGFLTRLFIACYRVTAVVLGAGIAVVLYTVPVLAVAHVEVTGNQHLSQEAVLALAEVDGRNLLALDLPAAQARLLSNPWVAQATVRRQLPATVAIQIQERRPAAVWQSGGDRYLMADDGLLLESALDDAGLPAITDIDSVAKEIGRRVPSGPAVLAQELLRELPQAGGDPVAGFEYRRQEGLLAVTVGGLRIAFGDGADLPFQLATYRGLLTQANLEKLKVQEIDLRFGVRPVLRLPPTPTPKPTAVASSRP